MGCLCRATCNMHSISVQTRQERIKCTKAKDKLRSYCPNIYTVITAAHGQGQIANSSKAIRHDLSENGIDWPSKAFFPPPVTFLRHFLPLFFFQLFSLKRARKTMHFLKYNRDFQRLIVKKSAGTLVCIRYVLIFSFSYNNQKWKRCKYNFQFLFKLRFFFKI